MNLRVALDVIARRLADVKLRPGADVGYHSTFNRAPLSSPSPSPQARSPHDERFGEGQVVPGRAG